MRSQGMSQLVYCWLRDRTQLEQDLLALEALVEEQTTQNFFNLKFVPDQKSEVAVIVCDVQEGQDIWDLNVCDLRTSLGLYQTTVLRHVEKHKGTAISIDGFRIVVAFSATPDLVNFGTEVQV